MQEIIDLIKQTSLIMAPEGGSFTLRNGTKSNYYIDLRRLHLSPSGLRLVVDEIGTVLNYIAFDAIGGPSIGVDPIIGGLVYSAPPEKVGFLVRPASKDHGMSGRIIGPLEPGMKVVMIDDVVTSGASLLDSIAAVEEFGCEIRHIIAVLDRQEGATELFRSRGYSFTSLLTIGDLGL